MEQLILTDEPSPEAIEFDVLFVGAGPAGLAGAIELANQAKKYSGSNNLVIGVLEKASLLGEHCLSGALLNPRSLFELFGGLEKSEFPNYGLVQEESVQILTRQSSLPIPTPPTMRNEGYYIVSLCELVRWMGERAEKIGIQVLTGFAAASLLVQGSRVVGVRTTPVGLNRMEGGGTQGPTYLPPSDIRAKIIVLAEGVRGTLSQAYCRWQRIRSANPQIFALGVKELWETSNAPKGISHTLGWPLPRSVFGGTWLYPMGSRLVSFGLVVGLDYPQADLDVHSLLQKLKKHPYFKRVLRGGTLLEWGAKAIPEGGFYSIPDRLHGDNVMIAGDSAGLVNVASLKGIHYAIQSGIFAGQTAFNALQVKNTSAKILKEYDSLLEKSYVFDDLYRTRNMRLAFKKGLFQGGIKSTLLSATSGRFPKNKIQVEEDAQAPRYFDSKPLTFPIEQGELTKENAVFFSGNKTRDTIPNHLITVKNIPLEVAKFYSHLCPAGVYEVREGKLKINPANCIDCKTTDILGPRWTPREGGSGPRYRKM